MSENMYSDEELMDFALFEQGKCISHPKVGAVIAKDGKILSTGYRNEVEGKHAERVAIEKLADDQLAGSTLYTTMEPCIDFYKDQKIESCADLILKAKIKEVYIGSLDNNGDIYQKGYAKLENNGVLVKKFSKEKIQLAQLNSFSNSADNIIYGSRGKKVIAVLQAKSITIHYSTNDSRSIVFRLSTVSPRFDMVDIGADPDSIRMVLHTTDINLIDKPLFYNQKNYFARLKENGIAIVLPPGNSWAVAIKIKSISEKSVYFQWKVVDV